MKLAIIGRPNVGKSTLFNRLVGRGRVAIVGDTPGVTRDRKYARADFFGLDLQFIDTPGVDPFSKDPLAVGMNEQSFAAIRESDAVMFVVDAVDGETEYDKAIASWIRSALKNLRNSEEKEAKETKKREDCAKNHSEEHLLAHSKNPSQDFSKKSRPIILVINKCEGKHFLADTFQSLGFGEGIAISAEHNLGIDELYSAISELNNAANPNIDLDQSENESSKYQSSSKGETEEESKESRIKIAIVGRPNVGKSTLINAIISEERLLTGDQAGITRDAIVIDYIFRGRHFSLIDTAGQRKKSKVIEKIETTAVLDAWRYIKQANIVVVLMDINNPLEKQDVTIARKAFDEGKIVIFALNKSDTVSDPEKIAKNLEERAEKEFAQIPGIKCLLVSAKEKKGLARIFNTSLDLLEKWSARVPTAQLNRWFSAAIGKNPPPLVNGMPIKLKYISQTNTRPPTFVLFANRAEYLPKSYARYLLNQLRNSFDLEGIPLRIFVRQRENPLDK